MKNVRKDAFELGVNLFIPKTAKTLVEVATWVLRCMAFHTDDAEVGRYSESIEAYKEAIRINPDSWEAHHGLGWVYSGLGRYNEAIEAFKQAIRIDPDDALANLYLGDTYFKLARYNEAIEAYKQAIQIEPDFSENAHYGLGLAYLEIKDRSMAIEQYKILKNLDVEKANTLSDLIYKLEAKELAMGREKAIPSRDYLVWLEKGFEMEKLGKYQEAVEAFRNCIRLAPPGHGDNLISLLEIKTPKLAMEMKKFWK